MVFPFPTSEWHMFVTSMRHVALSEYFSIKKEYSTYRWSGFKAALRRSFRFGCATGRPGHLPPGPHIECLIPRMLLSPLPSARRIYRYEYLRAMDFCFRSNYGVGSVS